MKKESKQFLDIIFRYLVLFVVAVPNLFIFYLLFTPITIYPVYFLFKILFDVSLFGNTVLINQTFPIQLISACIAGAAYYLLLILNLSTPGIKIKKRFTMIMLSFLIFLIINIIRIFLLGLLVVSGSAFFDLAHKIFWYGLSTIFVVGIWFLEIRIFKIKLIPIYSDIKFLIRRIR